MRGEAIGGASVTARKHYKKWNVVVTTHPGSCRGVGRARHAAKPRVNCWTQKEDLAQLGPEVPMLMHRESGWYLVPK